MKDFSEWMRKRKGKGLVEYSVLEPYLIVECMKPVGIGAI